MFELTPFDVPLADIFKDEDVPMRLWRLHPSLEESLFIKANSVGAAARLEATPAHAPTAAGIFHWLYTVAALRTELKALRWNFNDSNNCPLTISLEKNVMIAVMTGDKDTGRPAGFPRNKGIKGVVLDKAIKQNLQLFTGQGGAGVEGTELWVFLYHVEVGGEIRMELSLPASFVRGKIMGWKERIIFRPLDSRPEPKVLPSFPNEEIDFEVTRKAV